MEVGKERDGIELQNQTMVSEILTLTMISQYIPFSGGNITGRTISEMIPVVIYTEMF